MPQYPIAAWKLLNVLDVIRCLSLDHVNDQHSYTHAQAVTPPHDPLCMSAGGNQGTAVGEKRLSVPFRDSRFSFHMES